MDQLPEQAKALIDFIADFTGAPVHMVSTGPDRGENILIENPMA